VAKVDQAGADRLVGRALDAGINFFNTADAYAGGQSEVMLGKALGKRRGDVVIATKVGFRTGAALIQTGLSRRHIAASAEASLQRLGTDYIDVYLVHRLDAYTPIEETLSALEDLVRQGKVRYVGFSNWPAWRAALAVGIQQARHWTAFSAAEMYYSLVGRDLEHEVAPFAEEAGIGIMVWSPLAGGFLTGRYSRAKPQGDGGRLAGFDILPFDRDKGYDVVERLQAIAKARGASPAQIAIAWLLTRPAVASVLVGASKVEQLEDNLAAAELDLSAEDLKALDALTAPPPIYPNWFNRNINDEALRAALGEPTGEP
jgi:aryl-alcohol dehydrogenase-like predicted oxidoreductase